MDRACDDDLLDARDGPFSHLEDGPFLEMLIGTVLCILLWEDLQNIGTSIRGLLACRSKYIDVREPAALHPICIFKRTKFDKDLH